MPRLLIHWTLLVLLATSVVREDHLGRRFLQSWPIRCVGVVSYGLYHLLVYWPVSRILEHAGIYSRYVLFAALAPCSWLIAEISYYLFERPFFALKYRYSPMVGSAGAASANPFCPVRKLSSE